MHDTIHLVPPQSGSSNAPRRPDASMALISDLTNQTVEAAYRAARPPDTPPPITRAGRKLMLCGALVLAGLVLGTSARQTHDSAPAAKAARDQLIDQVRTSTAATNSLQQEFTSTRDALDGARNESLSVASANSAVQSDDGRLAILAGVNPAHGPGLRVIVDDAPDAGHSASATGRVRDTDLQRLLNGLWAAGAEAISVNGQRLTVLTAVRTAGDAILVAYRPLSPPYEVLAIGSPNDLQVDFVDGPGGRWFHTLADRYGIKFNVATAQDLSLPGSTGATLRIAEEANPS
jgi:uncharacterized protein YlxW (UPF0749 family)